MPSVTDDAVCYAQGASELRDFDSYHGKVFDELRKHYFAIFMHGNKFQSHNWESPQHFAPILNSWHANKGKGRAILLICCWAGWTFAAPLSRVCNLPILAALSSVSFTWSSTDGIGISAADESALKLQRNRTKKYRAEWVFFSPKEGRTTLTGGRFINIEQAIELAKAHRSENDI